MGDPFLVADKVQMPSVSADGTLLYSAAGKAIPGSSRLVWVDRSGKISGSIGREQEGLGTPALSPDGRRVAVSAIEQQGNGDIWVHDVSRGNALRLTFHPAQDIWPVWSPDGTRLAFSSFRSGQVDIYVAPSDASGSAEILISGDGWDFLSDWSSDSHHLLYTSNLSGNSDLFYRSFTGGASMQFTDTPHGEGGSRLSPDGGYVAYGSNESGRDEVYVTRFPSGEGKWQVSVDGGTGPRWSRKGDELFFIAGNTLMAVDVRTGASFEAGTPVALFSSDTVTPPLSLGFLGSFDVSPDGRRFVVVQQVTPGEPGKPVITLVQDWAERHLTP
jgi:serine/threonine-protein kinase